MTKTKVHKKAPFKGDHVGSFLRPERIKQARIRKANGKITDQELRQIENEEIIKLVEKQKEAGLKSITDGEFRRAWWHFDFLENLKGVEGYEPEHGIQFDGVETKAHAIRVTGKVAFNPEHPMFEDFRFLYADVGDEHVAKMTIPSPNMLFFRGKVDESVYPDAETLLADITAAYRKTIQAFYDLGCRYLQLDDTAWAAFLSEKGEQQIRDKGYEPEQLKEIFARAINESIRDRPEDMLITMHICRGNFRSSYTAAGPYDGAAETIFAGLDVDGLFLEYDNDRSGGFEPLRYVNRKDQYIVLGLITSKYGELENKTTIKNRIAEAGDYVPYAQLCLSPQCGFASTEEGNLLTEEEQWEKIRHVLAISEKVWGE